MKKEQRSIELLVNYLSEVYRIEQVIASLPRGYISVKTIAGHTYYYRQWREGNKIISSYVPDAYLKGVKQKIIIRKENEQLLKITKKDLLKSINSVKKAQLLTEEQIELLKEGVKFDNLPMEEKEKHLEKTFINPSKELKKVINYYLEGNASYNNVLLASWGL